jgi:hypothetical protein
MLTFQKLTIVKIISCIVILTFMSNDIGYSMTLRTQTGNIDPTRFLGAAKDIDGEETSVITVTEDNNRTRLFTLKRTLGLSAITLSALLLSGCAPGKTIGKVALWSVGIIGGLTIIINLVEDYNMWKRIKIAINKQFENDDKREEVLTSIKNLKLSLKKNGLFPDHVLYVIPAIVSLAKTHQDIKDICDMLLKFDIKLAENKIDSIKILKEAMPEVIRVSKNIDELKLFTEVGIKLAEEGVTPEYVLQDAIPSIMEKRTFHVYGRFASKVAPAKISQEMNINGNSSNYKVVEIAKTLQDIRDICNMILKLNIKVAKSEIDIRDITWDFGNISAVGEDISMLAYRLAERKAIGKTENIVDEFKLLLELGIRLVENGISTEYIKESAIWIPLEFAETLQDMRDICDKEAEFIMKLEKSKHFPSTLKYTIMQMFSSVSLARNKEELELFMDFAIKLLNFPAWDKINRNLKYGIPAAQEAAKNFDELKLFINHGCVTTAVDMAPHICGYRIYVLNDEVIEALPRVIRDMYSLTIDPDKRKEDFFYSVISGNYSTLTNSRKGELNRILTKSRDRKLRGSSL